jgi:hypothetical protein
MGTLSSEVLNVLPEERQTKFRIPTKQKLKLPPCFYLIFNFPQTVAESRQGVVTQLGGWAMGSQLLAEKKKQLVTKQNWWDHVNTVMKLWVP